MTKCDYGTCAWGETSLLNLNLTSPMLINAGKALSPFFLRLGGSLSDLVRYDVNTQNTPCVPFSLPTNNTRLGYDIGTGCLNLTRWSDLNTFCELTRCNLIFNIGALFGRQNTTCPVGTDCRNNATANLCCKLLFDSALYVCWTSRQRNLAAGRIRHNLDW